jgi:hypothetical protein
MEFASAFLIPPATAHAMKPTVKTNRLPACCHALIFTLLALPGLQAQNPAPALPVPPGKPKIAILPAKITVNGLPRPDLGQSLSDIINARLLLNSSIELLDASTLTPDPEPPAPDPAAAPPTPGKTVTALSTPAEPLPAPVRSAPASGPTPTPAQSVVAAGKAIGADFVVLPTVIGIGNEFRLTLREIQIPDGKIISIIHEKTSTGLKGLYALADNHAFRLIPPRPPVARVHTGPTIIDHPTPPPPPAPAPPPVSEQDIATAPKALANISPAKLAAIEATKRMLREGASPSAVSAEPSLIGRISELDLNWSFCTIAWKSNRPLPAGTALFAVSADNPETIINLRVTRLEGSKIIADFGANPQAATLRAGDKVYEWKVPALTP